MSRSRRDIFYAVVLVLSAGCSRGDASLVKPLRESDAAFPFLEPVTSGSPGDSVDLAGIWFRADGEEGWAVGSRGTILHYARSRWHRDTVQAPGAVDWRSVAFGADGRTGWAVGSRGGIARYLGNGLWRALPAPDTSAALLALWLDRLGVEGYAVGTSGNVLALAGDQWTKLSLPRGSTLDLTAVAANEDTLWVRSDSGVVTEYARSGNRWLQKLVDIDASTLWGQPSSATVWMAGVTKVLTDSGPVVSWSDKYTLRWRTRTGTGRINQILFMPETGAMSGTRRCGIVAGIRTRTDSSDIPSLAYVDSVRSYLWRQGPAAAVRGVWVNEQCTDGWVAGDRGLLSHVDFRPLRISRLASQDGSSLEKLNGEYRLVLSPLRDTITLDSMHLLAGEVTFPLLPDRDFKAARISSDSIRFELTDALGTRAVPLSDKSLRLRFFTSYAISFPRYPIIYEKVRPFTFNDVPWWRKLSPGEWGILGYVALSLLLVFLAIPFEWARELLLKPRPLFDRDWGQLVFVISRELIHSVPPIRRSLFRAYRANAAKKLSPPPSAAPAILIEKACSWLAAGHAPFPNPSALYAELRTGSRDRVLWILHEPGSGGDEVLQTLVHTALEKGDTAFLVTVDGPESILKKIGREMERFGGIPKDATGLIERGAYVVLLSVASSEQEAANELKTFIEDFRLRNLIIVCSSASPPIRDTCVIRLGTGPQR
jgi:hypothetical protein